MNTLSAALLLFLVMDPLGNIPLFMTTLKKVDEKRQRFVVVRELLIALAVLIGFFCFSANICLRCCTFPRRP